MDHNEYFGSAVLRGLLRKVRLTYCCLLRTIFYLLFLSEKGNSVLPHRLCTRAAFVPVQGIPL